MSNDELDKLIRSLEEAVRVRTYNKLAFYVPYPKQSVFHNAGSVWRERMLRAGNQEGKTYSAAAETAMHLTGLYPPDWKGRRFTHATRGWAAGESSVVVRDTMQKLLCGTPGVPSAFGTGFIPKDRFVDKPSLSRGVTDAYDTIQVMHTTDGKQDGISTLAFKSYEQGRPKFQSDTIDFAWCDEEPPFDIYTEILTRTTATGGMVFVTFTPLNGKTPLLIRFMDEKSPDRGEVVMTIYDAEHIKPEDRERIIAGWPEHERDARAMGVPMMGEGRVFPYPDSLIMEDPIPSLYIPAHWTRLWGVDFGTGGMQGHPFAAVLTLWDRDADVIHVHAALKTSEPLVIQHVAMMKPVAELVRVAWPHDGNVRASGFADEAPSKAGLYKKAGLKMLPEHATFETGGFSTEAGILEMAERMKTGRFKVSSIVMQGDFGNEFRSYHRKDGQIVKLHDDLMSAARQAVMMKRKGDTTPLGPDLTRGKSRRGNEFADGLDFPLF